MEKTMFFEELKDNLELEGAVNESTQIHLTSLSTLVLIALIDEKFNKQVRTSEFKAIQNVYDLMKLIGIENFN